MKIAGTINAPATFGDTENDKALTKPFTLYFLLHLSTIKAFLSPYTSSACCLSTLLLNPLHT